MMSQPPEDLRARVAGTPTQRYSTASPAEEAVTEMRPKAAILTRLAPDNAMLPSVGGWAKAAAAAAIQRQIGATEALMAKCLEGIN
jgi:hypothetical protein